MSLWFKNLSAGWEEAPLKSRLARNEGGVWGDDPDGGDTDTVVLRSTEQCVDGAWAIEAPALRKLTKSEAESGRLQVGDLVVTKSSGSELHIGKTSLVTPEVAALNACYSNFMQRLRVDARTDPRFVHYWMNNELCREQFAYLSNSTSGLANLNGTVLGTVRLAFPSLGDQQRIANFLDEQTARIDALIAEKERLDEALKEYRLSLISAAVTGSLGDRAFSETIGGLRWQTEAVCGADEEGVGVTSSQDVRRLKYAVEACVNGVWGDEPNGEDDMVVVRVADFDRSKGIASLGDSPTVRAIPESARNRRVLRPGDLLIEKSGGGEQQSVGNVVLFTDDRPAVCSNFVARMPVIADCDSRFVGYVFRALYAEGRNVPHIKQTSGIQNLDSESYLNEMAWLPAKSEQERIANFLDEQTARVDALRQHVREHIARLREYRSSLISAAVTGQLDISTYKPH